MEQKVYDVVVIGGGTAGSNAARAACASGAQSVLLIHTSELLNTCAEEGCMPSKSIIHASQEGLPFTEATARMDKHITRLLSGLKELLEHEAFEILEGTVAFTSPQTIRVTHGDTTIEIEGKSFVVATGSSSFIPPIAGLETISKERILTSEDIVSRRHIQSLPQRVFILGGGPIGLELMGVFKNFGSTVYLVDMGHLLSRMDPEFGEAMEHAIEEMENVTLLTEAHVVGVREENGVVVNVEVGGSTKEYVVDTLLFATGRRGNTQDLCLEVAGVEFDDKGRPQFDPETLRSANERIYFAGDVTGAYQILHFAGAMGRVAGENAARGDEVVRMDYTRLNMGVIFSDPQVGNIGLTETAARAAGIEVVTASLDLPNIGRGLLEAQPMGIWKIVVDAKTEKIIGAQAIGPSPHSEWFVDTIAWIIHFGGTVTDLKEKEPYYHPTYPELLQSMGRDVCRKLGKEQNSFISPN